MNKKNYRRKKKQKKTIDYRMFVPTKVIPTLCGARLYNYNQNLYWPSLNEAILSQWDM